MEQASKAPQAAPDRYRWVIVIAASLLLAVALGQLVNGLSAFFTPLETAMGWSRADIALINSAGLIGLALGGIAGVGQLQLLQPFFGLALAGLLLGEPVAGSMIVVTALVGLCIAGAKRFA